MRAVGMPRQASAVGLATFFSVVENGLEVIGRQRPRRSADVVHRMQCHENN